MRSGRPLPEANDTEEEPSSWGTLRATNQLLRAVTEGTTDAIFVKDRSSRYLMINPAGARAFGMSPEEVLGKDDTALFDEESARVMSARDAAILASCQTVTYESTSTNAAGMTRVWLSTKGPYSDFDGNVIGIIGMCRDITERKQAEESQRLLAEVSGVLASSLKCESTLQRMAELLVPAFADACVVHVMDPVHELRPLAVKVAACAVALQAPGEDPAVDLPDELVESVLRGGRTVTSAQIDADSRRALSARGFQSLTLAPVLIRGRSLGCVSFASRHPGQLMSPAHVALAQELGRRAGLCIDNARLYREAQEANRLKDEFLGVISHELRTPLTAILGWTNILRTRPLSEEARLRALATMERNALAQARLIDDLMDGSSIMAGKLQLELAELELLPAVEAAVETMRPSALARQIRLVTVLDRSRSSIRADASRLQQVISNLVSNALKFAARGGTIEIRTWIDGGRVFLSVKDDGEGISPGLLPYIFERFRQGDSSTRRRHGGLGMGLSIVKHLVESHGGTVSAESAGRGHGATFTVNLPLMASVSAPQRASSTADAPVRRLSGCCVLLVEDEADILQMLQDVLANEGAEVKSATSAEQALESMTRWRPDLIVSDIGMPDEDGYALMRRVRALGSHLGGEAPAIALTAHASAAHRARALAAGYQAYLCKPIKPTEFVQVATELIGRVAPGSAGNRRIDGVRSPEPALRP